MMEGVREDEVREEMGIQMSHIMSVQRTKKSNHSQSRKFAMVVTVGRLLHHLQAKIPLHRNDQ